MDISVCKDDSGTVEACIKGNVEAWESLVAKYSPLIYAAITGRIRRYGMSLPSQDIEDIYQNVLTSVWVGQKLYEIKNRSDISYWLAIVSGNTAVEYLRELKASGMDKMEALGDTSDEENETADIASAGLAPCQKMSENKIPDEVKNALRCLRKKEKLIMKLLIFHDKEYKEIAGILKMPKATVASHIRRARAKLKKFLRKKYIFPAMIRL